MSFTTVDFTVFLAAALAAWYLLPRRFSSAVLLAFSLGFYAFYGLEYLPALLGVVAAGYAGGFAVESAGRKGPKLKKLALAAFLLLILGCLALYKYANFFAYSVTGALGLGSASYTPALLRLAAPVGLSFFTLTAAGYLIDVYRGKYAPEKNVVSFALFVTFFPQIASGPIPRGDFLLPQINERRAFDFESARKGAALLVWGAFVKLVAADNLGAMISRQYSNWMNLDGLRLLVASALYGVQIYCDFSAYSYMARGAAKLFSLELPKNFRQPYLSRSIREFWRRWHISLSSWFRNYLYFPLGGSRRGKLRKYINTLVVFLASGLWHGAAWNFVVWGGLHGAALCASDMTDAPRAALRKRLRLREGGVWDRFARPLITFLLVDFLWIFFNAPSFSAAIAIIGSFFKISEVPYYLYSSLGVSVSSLTAGLVGAAVVFVFDLLCEKLGGEEAVFDKTPRAARVIIVYALVLAMLFYGRATASGFIYFKF